MANEFELPPGYKVWCHTCGKEPFNKITNVNGTNIPGVGFKSVKESQEHDMIFHRVWKG